MDNHEGEPLASEFKKLVAITSSPDRRQPLPCHLDRVRDCLVRIDELMQAKAKRDREDCIRIGESWYEIKDHPLVKRGDLKKLAPDFRHDPGTLQKCMRLYVDQPLFADADNWALATGYTNDYGFEPYHSLALLKSFKEARRSDRCQSVPDRKMLSDSDDAITGSQITLLTGDCRTILVGLPAESFNCCVTSPPYYHARNYDHGDQIGLEASVQDYIQQLVQVLREVKRLLIKDGVAWVVIDDCWAGRAQKTEAKTWFNYGRTAHPADPEPRKTLIGVPDMLRTALRNDGWLIRSNIIWLKTHGNFESVRDRPTHAYQSVIMLTKSARYWYDADVREPSQRRPTSQQLKRGKLTSSDRNITDVWAIAPESRVDHPAPFPVELAMNCIRRSCPVGGQILDPFAGSGSVGVVAKMLDMRCTLVELNPDYVRLAKDRIAATPASHAAEEGTTEPAMVSPTLPAGTRRRRREG